ncbi:MAG: DUF2334 domain-containing protein [Candidatus Paceibacterota bacterium]
MIFRIDDIGASTKQFEQYSKIKWANFWFLKKISPFKAWGPYRELTAKEWENILLVFGKNNIKPIIAITASWVEKDSSLTSFPEKFPKEAAFLKKSFLENKIEIANHGLTHCVIGRHLPLFNASNRYFHREFWPDLESSLHEEHIKKSQFILENYFGKPISIFVPSGNVWSIKTYHALKNTNIKKIISGKYMLDSEEKMSGIEFIDDRKGFISFHDRELKLFGAKWLERKIEESKKYE